MLVGRIIKWGEFELDAERLLFAIWIFAILIIALIVALIAILRKD